MPHCLGEIVMWIPDFGSHAFAVVCRYYFQKVEESSWMEVSGSAVHLWASRPVACWRWSGRDGDLKSPDFQSHIPKGWFCLMNDLYWRREVKRSMSLLSFDGVCICAMVATTLIWCWSLWTVLWDEMFYPGRIFNSHWCIVTFLQMMVTCRNCVF